MGGNRVTRGKALMGSVKAKQLQFETATEVTIASGAIAVSRGLHKVDTESDAATDDLDSITGGSEGQFLILKLEAAARNVVLTHAIGADKIATPGGKPVELDLASDYALLLHNGTQWNLIACSAVTNHEARPLMIPVDLASIPNGAGPSDVLTNMPLVGSGRVSQVDFHVTKPATTAAKLATLNLEINTTDLTGGAVALTSANCTPVGAKVAGSAITANNSFRSGDTLSVEATAVTAFAEGQGFLIVWVQ